MTSPPTPPYTEATRDLIAENEGKRRNGAASDGRGWYRTAAEREECYAIADAALNALVKAGLLLPEGAETRTEYGLRRGDSVAAYRSRADAEMWQNWSTPGWELVSHTVAATPWTAEGGGEADQSNASDLQPEIATGDNRCSYCMTKDRDECPGEQA